ncbi:MAG TPA: hypothetical protein RMH99_26115 [Sandaracinaceae bacterium LLY-WYZ-13_1]|nr:hypothetical protein [Sandaracinaceae bacterium LLY-WYZ-13_1]
MNFVGHAAVARWVGAEPRWVLGAMLPDLAGMARARVRDAADPRVAAGIAFHHVTDDAFHGAASFLRLQVEGAAALEGRGLGRGPARAVAHVGPELLIDGLLLEDEGTCAAYLDALEPPPGALGLRFRGEGGADRFARLHARLRAHGLPDDYRSPARVGHRLVQILRRRPRLALPEEALPSVVPWLEDVRQTLVDGLLGRLLDEVAADLSARGALPTSDAHAGSVDTVRRGRDILRGRQT